MLTDKLTGYASTATVAIMFFCVTWLQPTLVKLGIEYHLAGILAAGLIALGVYRMMFGILLWLFKNSRCLRMLILGKSFIEGTWVGYYCEAGEHRFTKEHIDQSTGETIIRGREFSENGNTRSSWVSDTLAIDLRKMELVYAYTCKVLERKNVQEGLGVFNIVFEKDGRYASQLDGYAVDLIDGDRDRNREFKISDGHISDEDALEQARKIFIK